MRTLLAVAAVLPLCAACSYAISPEIAGKADRTVPFAALLNDSSVFAGRVVIEGGVIIGTTRAKAGAVIDVEQRQLDYWGRPLRTRPSGGRFLVFTSQPLDPAVYEPGREITVAGVVLDPRRKDLPDNPFGLPVLRPLEIKLWPRAPQSGERPSWWDPLHDPDARRGL